MSPKWTKIYAEIDALALAGKVRIIQEPNPGFPLYPKIKYIRICPNCQAEHTLFGPEYLLKKMQSNFCKWCWRDDPKHQPKYISYPRRTSISLDFPVERKNGMGDLYCRVSTSKQALGDGLRRQEEGGIEYCKKNKIKVRNIIHDVCSAYNMDPFIKGNLGLKIKEWKEGKETPPNFFVIETMCRLSRQLPSIAMEHVYELLDMGITFVTLWDGIGGEPMVLNPSAVRLTFSSEMNWSLT